MILKLNDKKGKLYYYNKDNIQQVCNAWAKNAALVRYKRAQHSMPFGGKMFTLELPDWVKDTTSAKADNLAHEIRRIFHNQGAETAIQQLNSIRNQTKKYLQTYFETVEQVNTDNAGYIKKMDNGVFWSKLTRDLSASALVVGAGMIAASAAAAAAAVAEGATVVTAAGATYTNAAIALTGGSALKGVAKFQDTGNIGAAGIEFICEMGVGLLGFGAASKAEQLMVVLFAKMPAEATKSLVGGDSLTQVAVATLAEGFGLDMLKDGIGKALAKTVIPGALETIGKSHPKLLQDIYELAGGVVDSKLSDMTKDQAKASVNGSGGAKPGIHHKISGNKKSVISLKGIQNSHINHRNGSLQFARTYCISPHVPK